MLSKSKIWYLENFNLFEGLKPDKMMELDKKMSMNNIKRNQIIYFADEPSSSIFLLKEGQVKLSRVSDDGREAIIAILKPGEIFGELAITGETNREDSAIAMDEAVICTISKENFEMLLMDNPKLNLKIIKIIGLKLQKVERGLENMIFKDSYSRINYFLVNYAKDYGKKIGDEIFIKSSLTHQDIANLTATSRQTVTTAMNKLKDKKIIDFTRNRIIIRNLNKLQKDI